MIIVLKQKVSDEDLKRVVNKVEKFGLTAHVSQGEETTIVGLVGDVTKVDSKQIEVDEAVTDPTTKGVADSERALNYHEPRED